MGKMVVQRALITGLLAGILFGLGFLYTPAVHAYTTKSPEVQEMVRRAIPFLEKASHEEPGGMAVIGMALLKSKVVPKDHPKIVEMFEAVKKAVREQDPAGWDTQYSTGLSLVFLASYKPEDAGPEIQRLIDSLRRAQKPSGGWGYKSKSTGDTSMTQYAVLGLWEAQKTKFNPPQTMIDNVATWLLRTQDPSGAWGYQGTPSNSGQLVKQEGISHTMVAAGLGSAYICNDLLGFTPKAKDEKRSDALKELGTSGSSGDSKVVHTRIDKQRLYASQQLGDAWLRANFVLPKYYISYFLYTFERCQTFRELAATGELLNPEVHEGPPWYTMGVDFLRKTQSKKEGSWENGCGDAVDTGLAVLFLMRSTYQSVAEDRHLGQGEVVGYVGIPEDDNFTVKQGRVVRTQNLSVAESMDKALGGVEIDVPALEAAALAAEKNLGGKKSDLLVKKYEKKLREILNDPSPDNRERAIIVLASGGDLDNVPLFIKALEDDDLVVVRAARDALRRLSRKFHGFGLSDDPSKNDRRLAADKWRAWYLSIRPDAEI
ncbi:MAG: HEAT repeat domain-containing protein [Pirellulales bacterium]|nr:HEAT repeat domain-containing protein [Pirellulales bacterium]